MSQEHKHDRQILIFLVAALMIGGGLTFIILSPPHDNKGTIPINPQPSPVITPMISPWMTVSSNMNPAYDETTIVITATVYNFQPVKYTFYHGTTPVQSNASNELSYFIPSFSSNPAFCVVATNSTGYSIQNSTIVQVVMPPCIFVNSTSTDNVASHGAIDLSSNPVEFTASSIYQGIPPYSYQWFVNGNRISGATGLDLNYSFSTTGNYTFYSEWTDETNGIVHHFYSDDYTEQVVPPLKAYISASHNPSDIGKPITFRINPSGSTGNYTSYSYRLYSSDSNLSSVLYSGTTPSFSAILDSAGTYLISYEVESSNGFYQNATLTQYINSDPSVSISANKTTTDVGNPVSFSLSPTGGTSPYSYSWFCSSNGSSSSYVQFASGNSPVLKFSKEGTYYILVQLTDSAGFTVNSTSLVITVNPAFSAYLSTNVGDKALINECITITLNCVGGSGQPGHLILPVFDFSLSPNITFYNAESEGNQIWHVYTEPGIHYIGAKMSDAAGSVARAIFEITIYSNNIKISFHPKKYEPVGVLVNLNASVSTTFSPPTISQISYIWTINGVNYSGNNYLYDFATPGIYNITLTVGALTPFTTSTSSDQNRTYATVIASSPGNSSSIIINPKESPISGGVSFSWYTSFKNSSEYSYYLLIQGNGASPTQVRTLSNGTLYIEANVFYSNYAAGTYAITLIVYNNKSQSNQSTMGFSVSLSQSNQVTLSTVIEWFGGLTNFIVVVGTIIGIGGTIWAIHANENPNVIIESGNGNQSKKILVKGKKIRGKK